MSHPGDRNSSKPSSPDWGGEPARPEWPLCLDSRQLEARELPTRCGNRVVVWFDGLSPQAKSDRCRSHKVICEIQPVALINKCTGLAANPATPEQRLPKRIPRKGARVIETDPNGQGLSLERNTARKFLPRETGMTNNETCACNKNGRRFKSATELIRGLIGAASKGRDFPLNVGPTPEERIQTEFVERRLAMRGG